MILTHARHYSDRLKRFMIVYNTLVIFNGFIDSIIQAVKHNKLIDRN